jgi:hypothetical protein
LVEDAVVGDSLMNHGQAAPGVLSMLGAGKRVVNAGRGYKGPRGKCYTLGNRGWGAGAG